MAAYRSLAQSDKMQSMKNEKYIKVGLCQVKLLATLVPIPPILGPLRIIPDFGVECGPAFGVEGFYCSGWWLRGVAMQQHASSADDVEQRNKDKNIGLIEDTF